MQPQLLTPPTLPEEMICKSINIPNSRQWLGIFDNLLLLATERWMWQQMPDSEITIEDTIAYWQGVIAAFWDDAACATGGGIPTPFWDDAADVDDQESAEEQTWYGYVTDPEADPEELTFIENAAIWTFTGFIAFASWEVGFAPAVVFHTIAPRFVLAWKRGDVGEIIRVIVDGAEAGTVDTTSAAEGELVEFNVVADQDLEEHELILVQVE